MQDNEKPCEMNLPIWSLNKFVVQTLYEKHPEWEYGFFDYDIYAGNITKVRSGKELSCISVSVKCQYPELAVQILEKVHTDQEFYDLISYGVEGIHYQRKGEQISYESIPSKDIFTYWVGSPDELLERENTWKINNGQRYVRNLPKTGTAGRSAPENALVEFSWEDNGLKDSGKPP